MRDKSILREPQQRATIPVLAIAISFALIAGAGIGLASSYLLPANASRSAEMPMHISTPAQLERFAALNPKILGPASAAPARGYTSDPILVSHGPSIVSLSDPLDLPLADMLTELKPDPVQVASLATPPGPEQVEIADARPVRPHITIVLDDLGLDEKSTRRAIELPAAVTLSFLPYGQASAGLAEEARARGHEIMAHIPMQPEGPEDPGPNALRVDLPADDISARLAAQLNKFPGAIGFNNHMGSRFTADVRALLPVMREARARGLLFLDSRTTANTLAAKVAEAAGTVALTRDVFLDHASGPDGLLIQLAELERIARMSGKAIGIAHPHALTLDVLDVWTRGLEAKGLALVPISVMAHGRSSDRNLLAASNR